MPSSPEIPTLGSDVKAYLQKWAELYKADLVGDVLPFWLKHGWDKKHGGFYTCLDRDGSLMDSEKSVWFQGRAGWIFAAAYNYIEKKPEYLEASKSCVEFIERHCFDTDGRMYYQVKADGTPVRKRRYVFSETFAVIAYAEYSVASGDKSWADKALKLFKELMHNLRTPGVLEPKFLPTATPGRGHSVCMIMLNTGYCLRRAIKDQFIEDVINESLADLKKYFMKEEFKTILEVVTDKGEFIDTNPGRTINPGHCIETGWFIIEESRERGWVDEITKQGLTVLDWAWDWGWDKEHGGIIYFRDCKNKPPQEYWHDMKFWWPQNEAIIATLYGYLATKDRKYLENHQLISKWTYERFPDREYGEWYGYFHKDGSLSQPAKGNMYKGPFHIPRMMIKGFELCNLILKDMK